MSYYADALPSSFSLGVARFVYEGLAIRSSLSAAEGEGRLFAATPPPPSAPVEARSPRAAIGNQAEWQVRFATRIARVSALKRGWDGERSTSVSPKALHKAALLTYRALQGLDFATAPDLVPGGDGSVQIEWHEKHGELELDIGVDGSLWLSGRDHTTGFEFEDENDAALDLFYRWAPWIAQKLPHADNEALPHPDSQFAVAA